MSEPVERYEPSYYGDMRWAKDGAWVEYADYARLKAEVESLRKAGDAMALCITEFRCGKYGNALDKVGGFYVWQDWQAAKEGKPSV